MNYEDFYGPRPAQKSFRENFSWQEQFLPAVKTIVGPCLLQNAPLEMDRTEATDLLVLRARDMRIGCRIRTPKYQQTHPWDFTLRSINRTGTKTELDKIIEGWGDWLFYGHAAPNGSAAISRWFLVDLDALRNHWIRGTVILACGNIPNGDGTFFRAWDVRTFPDNPPICVASSCPIDAICEFDKLYGGRT